MMQTLKNIGAWTKRHFDFALILAALVEIPRWTVTFLAIHEPLWVGIPLGALLAYATSEGWRAYFADPRRIKLLCFNIASLAAATFVITPVLFSMASAPIDEIDLAALLPFGWLLAWSGVLAVTTFAPLIQLAAVKSTPAQSPASGQAKTAQDAPGRKEGKKGTSTTVASPDATPVESGGHSEGAEQPGETSAAPQTDAAPDLPTVPARAQALHLRDEGYTPAEIARMTGAKYSTVQSWLRRATVQTN